MAAVVPFIPYIAAAAGAAIKTVSGEQVANRQKNDYLEGLRKQAASRTQAQGEIDNLTGGLKTSNPESYRAADAAGYANALQAHAAGINGSIPTVYGANARYGEDTARAHDATTAYATELADSLSRLDSVQQQRAAEGYRAAHTGSKLSQIQDFAAGNARMAELKAQGERENPWVKMLAGALTNAGSMSAAGGFGKTGATGYPGTTVTGQPIEAGVASGAGNFSPEDLTSRGVYSA